MALVALAASDLADPFQMTSPGLDEMTDGRARFVDAIDAPIAMVMNDPEPSPAGPALEMALALASESSALRDSAERVLTTGYPATLAVMQRSRLDAAVSLVRRAVAGTWQTAGVARAPVSSRLRILPTPAWDAVELSFAVRATGPVTFELYDLGGRRVEQIHLGRLAAGSHVVDLDRHVIRSLGTGLYFARVIMPDETITGRLVLATH